MDLLNRPDFLTKLKDFLKALRPIPNQGVLWKDCAFLLVIVFVQTTLLPSIIGAHVYLDIVTPWLLISFVHHRLSNAIVLALTGALALEMQSAVPAGLYLSSYCIMATVINQIRPTLYWQHFVPWIVIYGASSLWVATFETLVLVMIQHVTTISWQYWLMQAFRVISSIAFGMYLSHNWKRPPGEEAMPS
jgi:hypothetical protein